MQCMRTPDDLIANRHNLCMIKYPHLHSPRYSFYLDRPPTQPICVCPLHDLDASIHQLSRKRISSTQKNLLSLDQSLEKWPDDLSALLWVSLLTTLIIHICHSKPRLITLGPLKVVHDRPMEITADIDALGDRALEAE